MKKNARDTESMIETWTAAEAAVVEARTALKADQAGGDRLAILAAQIRVLEAEDAGTGPRLAASRATDAAEVASGDELAVSCDPARLGAELSVLIAEESRLVGELAAARESRAARATRAFACHAELAARRSAAGMPLPLPLPSGDLPTETFLVKLADGPAPPETNDGRIAVLRREERDLRASLERAQIEREEAEADRLAIRKDREADEARRVVARAAELAATRAAVAAEHGEAEKLAAAHRARTAGP